jgi:hypothetical protein
VSFAEREQARERERELERLIKQGTGPAGPRGPVAEGTFGGTPGPAGGSPRGGFGPPGVRPGRGRGVGPDEPDAPPEGPPSFRRRGRSSSRSPPHR